jgi:hypothetical protein
MATLYNSDLKPLASGEYTHYYDHATKLFLADNFRLAPKQKFLYYVCINIDQNAVQGIIPGFGGNDPASSQTLIEQYETGLLAKRVELPRFDINTKTYNAYNRKNIVQTQLRYQPLNITFHDDAADTVTRFWNDFYTYYYRDSDYDAQLYNVPHKYQPRPREGWGFSPRNSSLKPFLRNIQIFSLHNKRFTEYLLINPIIASWRHGDHDSSASNELMEATMQVEFETVKYRTGYVNPVDVNGFATIHYDDTPSPISNSVTNIYNDAGLIGVLTEGSQDLARPDGTGSGQGILGSVLAAYRFYNNLKDTNFNQLGKIVLGQVGASILGGAVNSAAQSIFFPTLSGTPGYGATYGGSQTAIPTGLAGATASTSAGIPPLSNSATINGQSASIVGGAATSIVSGLINDYTRGVQTGGSTPPNSLSTAVYRVQQTSPSISVDARSGQPVTNEYTAFITNAEGTEVIQEFTTVGTQSGGYDSTNPGYNVKYVRESVDQNGQIIRTYQYQDETLVTFNAAGDAIQVSPGTGVNPNNTNTNPESTRDLVSEGATVSPTATQYYTDPNTGITRVVNGGVSGLVRNTLSGGVGTLSGLYVGGQLYGGLKDAFGSGLIGSTVAAGISGIAATGIGVGVNNLVQGGFDYFMGTPGQSFNPQTGTVSNMVGTPIVSKGQYTPQYPSNNIISQTDNGDGTKTVYTADGGSSVVNKSDGSIVSSIKGAYNNFTNWLGSFGSNQDASILLPDPGTGVWVDGSGNPVLAASGGSVYTGSGPSYDAGTLEAWSAYENQSNYLDELGPSWSTSVVSYDSGYELDYFGDTSGWSDADYYYV